MIRFEDLIHLSMKIILTTVLFLHKFNLEGSKVIREKKSLYHIIWCPIRGKHPENCVLTENVGT